MVFRTHSGSLKGSHRVATHAGPITRAVDAISCRSLERGGLKGIGHGAAFSSWNNSDTHGWFLQRRAIGISLCRCSLTRLNTCGSRATGGKAWSGRLGHSWARGSVVFCKKIGQWELSSIWVWDLEYIFFGDKEVAAVNAWLALGWRNNFYGSFFQQIHHLCIEDLSVLAVHCGGEHTVEAWWSSSELKSIALSYRSHYPCWHTGDGPRGKGLKQLCRPAA